jgi:quercetin dioxygenase-like cupin family protein
MAWESEQAGQASKVLRHDEAAGEWFGLVRFEPGAQTGLHQHQGLASAYLLTGAIQDSTGKATEGAYGMNFAGDTHNAISYPGVTMLSRLDYPILYAPGAELATLHGMEDNETTTDFFPLPVRDRSSPEAQARREASRRGELFTPLTLGPGVVRKTHHDYAGDAKKRRWISFQMEPGGRLPRHSPDYDCHWFVLAGELQLNERKIRANTFLILEPGAVVDAAAPYGATVLVWADGPSHLLEQEAPFELYGFS